jgi:hypothetical protein
MPKAPAVLVETTSGKRIEIDDCFIEYMDLIASLLGITMNYEEFSSMNQGERLSYIRDFKINKIIN